MDHLMSWGQLGVVVCTDPCVVVLPHFWAEQVALWPNSRCHGRLGSVSRCDGCGRCAYNRQNGHTFHVQVHIHRFVALHTIEQELLIESRSGGWKKYFQRFSEKCSRQLQPPNVDTEP